jgi:hypothetical protein
MMQRAAQAMLCKRVADEIFAARQYSCLLRWHIIDIINSRNQWRCGRSWALILMHTSQIELLMGVASPAGSTGQQPVKLCLTKSFYDSVTCEHEKHL